MKMIEIQYASEVKELEKLEARLEKVKAKLEKAHAKAEKLNATWTKEEHLEWLKNCETQDGWMVNKEDINRNGAWYDLYSAEYDIEELKGKIERTKERIEKKEKVVDEYREQIAKIENLKEREKLMKLDFEREQKEWAKDGIKLDGRYTGLTPSGKRFAIYGNSGFTERSKHCYTLYIDCEVVFTSGEFWRAYGTIKNN